MMNVKELEKLRPCGRLETYSTGRHHLGYYNNVGLTATYTSLSGSSESLESIVYTALQAVVAEHTVLSAIPLDEEKSYPNVYFARLPTIDLRTCVEFRKRKEITPGDNEENEELKQMLTEEHSHNFKDNLGTKPFWRFIVLTSPGATSSFTAAWFFHHALADGTSATLFHNTFLKALNSQGATPSAEPIVPSPNTPLPPFFEDQHPLPISWPFFLRTLAKIFFPSIFAKRPPTLWTGAPLPATLTNPSSHFQTLAFSTELTQSLAKLARRHTTSMTATLECIFATALFAHLSKDKYDQLISSNPIAMRPFLKDVPDAQMTNAITSYSYTHDRRGAGETSASADFDWAETQNVKSVIADTLALKGRDNPIALLRYVSNIHEYLTSHMGKLRDASFEVSNIGVMKAPADGQWKLGRVVFSQCANPVGAAVGMGIVTGGDGCASLCFYWGEGVDQELMEKVVQEVKGLIEGLVQREAEEAER
ncbi:alcohol acetyltransferase [Phaeosphaeria sp. MPI-PUGE-AT-0046c]|nr:alcohol acetyltransferase [Phaeosphaeria sp. MPI-PUGE-AT-0046c]